MNYFKGVFKLGGILFLPEMSNKNFSQMCKIITNTDTCQPLFLSKVQFSIILFTIVALTNILSACSQGDTNGKAESIDTLTIEDKNLNEVTMPDSVSVYSDTL